MPKVYSKYLKTDLEVSVFEAMENGEPLNVISHESLENAVFNELDPTYGVKCAYECMNIAPEHCVFACTISDKSGRSIQTIGEASPETLETEMARKYPAIMASKRAFDRAAIRYLALDLSGRVLANTEADPAADAVDNGSSSIDVGEAIENGRKEAQESSVGEEGTKHTEGRSGAPSGATGAGKKDYEYHNDARAKNSYANSSDHMRNVAPAANTYDPGSVLCEVGTYRKSNKTIEQVYNENPGFIDWIVKKYTASNDAQKAIRDACVAYLQMKEAR